MQRTESCCEAMLRDFDELDRLEFLETMTKRLPNHELFEWMHRLLKRLCYDEDFAASFGDFDIDDISDIVLGICSNIGKEQEADLISEILEKTGVGTKLLMKFFFKRRIYDYGYVPEEVLTEIIYELIKEDQRKASIICLLKQASAEEKQTYLKVLTNE